MSFEQILEAADEVASNWFLNAEEESMAFKIEFEADLIRLETPEYYRWS